MPSTVKMKFGDIELHITNTYDSVTLAKQLSRLVSFDAMNRITYAIYLEGWYKNRGIKCEIKPNSKQGWFDRLLTGWTIKLERSMWVNRQGYASKWIGENLRREVI